MLVMLPLSWVLAHDAGWGLNGIVLAMVIASFVSSSLLLVRFWILTRRGL